MPRVRFAGFSGEWVERRLGDVLRLRSEIGNPGDYNFDVELENLVSDSGFLVGDTTVRTQSTTIFKKGDTLFGRLCPYLNKWWLADRDGVKSGEIWAFYPSEDVCEKYAYIIVQTKTFLDEANISTGTKMPRADWSKMSEAKIFAPYEPEQVAIGNFFYNIDKQIAIFTQKAEQLKQLKVDYLQKMFV